LHATIWHAQFSPLSRITLKICSSGLGLGLEGPGLGLDLEGPGLGFVLGLWILALTTTLLHRSIVPRFLNFNWVGLGQPVDGLGWIGSHKMDPWTTLIQLALRLMQFGVK